MKHLSKKQLVAILVIAAALCVFALIRVTGSNASSEFEVKTNESGQTYGSVAAVDNPEDEPDLILVESTNGKTGYVYREDLEAAAQPAENPEEAVAQQEAADERFAQLFAEELSALREGADAVTEAEAQEYLDAASTDSEDGGAIDFSGVAESASVSFSESELEEAYFAAREAAATLIPVYEEDGKTVIGEFPVG